MDSRSKLNLACGNEYLEGYTNIDDCSMYPEAKVDVKQDISSLEYPNNSIEEILLSHFLMYVRPEEATVLFKRWYGWLETGGRLIIESSDAQVLAKIILEEMSQEKINDWALINLFGKKGEPPHRWSWTPTAIMFELFKAGFSPPSRFLEATGDKKPDRDFLIIAIK